VSISIFAIRAAVLAHRNKNWSAREYSPVLEAEAG